MDNVLTFNLFFLFIHSQWYTSFLLPLSVLCLSPSLSLCYLLASVIRIAVSLAGHRNCPLPSF